MYTFPSGIHKDTLRAFRSDLEGLMEWKVSREAYKTSSKPIRRLAQIEAMKKLYKCGGNQRNLMSRDEISGKQEATMDDEGQIIQWLDKLKVPHLN